MKEVKVLHCQFQKENTRSFGFSELKKNNYNTVAKQQGVTKSLVFKWEKHKSKILAELTLNKMKKNRCSRPLRQRRRKRSQQTQLLLAKFKLQRAVARMKSKIEACYDAQEATKFKGSSNWFQRFKKRHKIVLWRRTHKKNNLCRLWPRFEDSLENTKEKK